MIRTLACQTCDTVEVIDWPDDRLPFDSPHTHHIGQIVTGVDVDDVRSALAVFFGRDFELIGPT